MVVISNVSVTPTTSSTASKKSYSENSTWVWSEPIFSATISAYFLSVAPGIPIENVLNFLPYVFNSLASNEATKEESNPPDNKAPIGLAVLILSCTALVNTYLIYKWASASSLIVIGIP